MISKERKLELIQFLYQELQRTQDVTEAIRDSAIELYNSLSSLERPPILTNNPIVGVFNDQGKEKYSTIPEYFNNIKNIEFLMLWTKSFLPLLKILLEEGHLPDNHTMGDFQGYINQKLDNYLEALNNITDHVVLSAHDIQVIGSICTDLKEALSKYLGGQPANAFEKLGDCMVRLEDCVLEPLKSPTTLRNPLYKMRLGSSNHFYSSDDMFHIPFQNRGLVKTNRYSIPGLPCVYLGSTPLTCWEEMGKPDLNSTHTSLFLPSHGLNYLDISIPPSSFVEHFERSLKLNYGVKVLTSLYGMLRAYLIRWPLIACCSVRVLNAADAFKPEYIIPQLLLQWVQKSAVYDGISYFSTKIDKYTLNNFPIYQNFAFPVKENKASGQCEELRAKFVHITKAVPWQVYQLHKGRGGGETSISERSAELELMPGIEAQYNSSDFGRLETFLIYVMEGERRQL